MGLENSENLIDDFELVNCIATGNTTQIWEVKHVGTQQPYAMKLLLSESMADAAAKASLKHEATVGKTLEHPHIIKTYDLKMTKKFGYFTMEYFRAPNLKAMLRHELPALQSRAKKLLESLAQALAYVHDKGWVHRDIKPDNILISKGGEFRLIDFSLCSKPSNSILHALTRKGAITIQGTRTYLAPELIQRQPLTFAADMYSLGIMFFEILTGFPPFRTGNPNDLLMMHVRDIPDVPSSFNKNVTPEADAIVMKMIAKNPKNRQRNMNELFTELSKVQLFKENAEGLATRRAEEAKGEQLQSLDNRLDSRADAARREAGMAAPEKATSKEKARFRLGKEADVSAAPKPAASAAPAPVQQPAPTPQMPMPGMFPGQMPGMMMPGGYPGMMPGMYPGMMPGQMPFAPGMPLPGQYPMPGQMPMPGQFPMPGQPTPMGMPVPGQMPAMGQIPSPGTLPVQSPPGAGAAPAARVPSPPPPVDDDKDVPLASMDDLIIE